MIERNALPRPSTMSLVRREGVAAGDAHARVAIRPRLLKTLTATLSPGGDLPAYVDDATGLLGHGIGLDSIETLAVVCALEEDFGVTVYDEDLDRAHFETVGSLVTFIQERLLS